MAYPVPAIVLDVVLWDHEDEATHSNGCGYGCCLDNLAYIGHLTNAPVRLDLIAAYTLDGTIVASWRKK